MNLIEVLTILKVWEEFGLRIEGRSEDRGVPVILISVPERSCRTNTRGEEIAGDVLAKRFRTALSDAGFRSTILKSRIRRGEYWSLE